jgi:hypothetical protein
MGRNPELSPQPPDRLFRWLKVSVFRQAIRLARWRIRREKIPSLKFKSPLRPGRPPGHRQKKTHEVDKLLTECHWLAFEALKFDTS